MRWNNVALIPLDLPTAQHYAESGIAALALKMRDTSLDQVGTPEVQMSAWIGMLWDTLGWILFEEGVPGCCTQTEKLVTTLGVFTRQRDTRRTLFDCMSFLSVRLDRIPRPGSTLRNYLVVTRRSIKG
jgi:hypothetical protein